MMGLPMIGSPMTGSPMMGSPMMGSPLPMTTGVPALGQSQCSMAQTSDDGDSVDTELARDDYVEIEELEELAQDEQ